MLFDRLRKVSNHHLVIMICIGLTFANLMVFRSVSGHDFIDFDDPQYVCENSFVQDGVNIKTVFWAFSTSYAANWHPLTWLSHMLDVQLFGLDPGWHHLVNLLLHIVNTVLFFLVLYVMTGALWRSGFVAMLFAIHPLHVESVVWISERKDLLSAFFWMGTMLTYVWFIRKPKTLKYLLVVVVYAMGLMAKPMLVTLPFVLLLLDYWPLGRWGKLSDSLETHPGKFPLNKWYALVWEKIPLFVLSAVSSTVTYLVQHQAGAVQAAEKYPFPIRVSNALISYIRYLWKTIWPRDLAFFYPHPGDTMPTWQILGAIFILGAVTVGVLMMARRAPFMPVGWFWYLGTLVPVIGLVQVGGQAIADRYSYIPLIGVFLMVGWGIDALLRRSHIPRLIPIVIFFVILVPLLKISWDQVGYWQNSEVLMKHAIKVTRKNHIAHINYGIILLRQNNTDAAIEQFKEAINARPQVANGYYNLGLAYLEKSAYPKALSYFKEARKRTPFDVDTHIFIGVTNMEMGNFKEAANSFFVALKIDPSSENAKRNLKLALEMEAIRETSQGK